VTEFASFDQVQPERATMSDDGRTQLVFLSIPARAEFIALSRLALTGLSRVRPFPEELLADLKLAITEACSNSVRHAYENGEGTVEIVYRLESERIEIEVSDDGTGFDHSGAGELPEDGGMSEGGLGIAIIRSIADEIEIGVGGDGRGSRLRFAKTLDA
jgi:serine/threonine-protein kinase RsbW